MVKRRTHGKAVWCVVVLPTKENCNVCGNMVVCFGNVKAGLIYIQRRQVCGGGNGVGVCAGEIQELVV